jgi:hypothetical protein
VHADLIGVDRLGGNVGDELVGVARVVFVVVVAEREVAELHGAPPIPGLTAVGPSTGL